MANKTYTSYYLDSSGEIILDRKPQTAQLPLLKNNSIHIKENEKWMIVCCLTHLSIMTEEGLQKDLTLVLMGLRQGKFFFLSHICCNMESCILSFLFVFVLVSDDRLPHIVVCSAAEL
jgi:hypothetical protein